MIKTSSKVWAELVVIAIIHGYQETLLPPQTNSPGKYIFVDRMQKLSALPGAPAK
jgi:hypothetical protein